MELACLLLEHAKGCFDGDDEYMQVGACGVFERDGVHS
jgi:hypothetical protein